MNTVELLETILLRLPCRQKLAAKRVCKLWHATFDGSRKLRVASCLAPAGHSTKHLIEITTKPIKPEITQAPNDSFNEWTGYHVYRQGASCAGDAYATSKAYAESGDVGINSMLASDFSSKEVPRSDLTCSIVTLRQYLKTRTPVWANMYLTQPPVPELAVLVYITLDGNDLDRQERDPLHAAWAEQASEKDWQTGGTERHVYGSKGFKITNDAGVTVADLMDALVDAEDVCTTARENTDIDLDTITVGI